MLKTLIGRRRLLLTTLLPSLAHQAGYQIINAFVPNADMILATRVLALGFYVPIHYIYWPYVRDALGNPDPETKHYLVVGIWISFWSHLGQDIFAVSYRLYPQAWLLNSEVAPMIVQLTMVASVLHATADAIDGNVPKRDRIALGAGIGIATVRVATLLFTRPNIGPLLEKARPFITDFWQTCSLPGLPYSPT